MTDKCGDDLIAARRFTNLCQAHMSAIFSGGKLPLLDVITRLSEIQSHAKLMHARSIYRSAQDIIDELTVRKSAQACAASVLVLQKLVRQYEKGLSEIAPIVVPVSKPVDATVKGPAIVTDLAQQKSAARTLTPLVKFAQGKDRAGLVSMIKYVVNETKSAPKKPKSDVVQNVESLLPDLTNHWLRLARSQEKSISVSSALDDISLTSGRMKTLQKAMLHMGELLITQSVENPHKRAAKSLSQSAHLAITGRKSEDQFNILISCEGNLPSADDFKMIAQSMTGIEVTARLEDEDQLIKIQLTGKVCKAGLSSKPAPKLAEAVL